jgi:glycosyltransferase involved in cell wall biosynthesis
VVALVAHGAHERSGMERALAELIRRAHAEFRLIVIARDLAPDLRPLVEWRRVRVPHRPVPLLFALFYVIAGFRLARTRADVIHTCGALVPNKADLASVHFCHAGVRSASDGAIEGRPMLRRINTRVQRTLGLVAERWSYGRNRIPLLAAVSGGVARELERLYPNARVLLTPNGVDTDCFRPDQQVRSELRRAEGVVDDEVIALFVGGDWDHKGLSVAIAALARVQLASPRLWVVGSGDERRFRVYAGRCGVAERVSFFGARSDVERFYQAADVLLLPSRYEAFPLVSLEAAACGIPIIATPVNGIEELLGTGDAGAVVERTPEAFATALAQLASDGAARARMGHAARRRALAYSWERSTASVLEIYRDLSSAAQPLAEGRAA